MWHARLLLMLVAAVLGYGWPGDNRILQLKAGATKSESPPSYMIHLYNRYRKGRLPYSGANTVRSFFPTPGQLGSQDLLVFNLTGVHPSEYIERVDFHLQSRSFLGRFDAKKKKLQVDVLDLTQPERSKIASFPLTKTQNGMWQTLDITDSIIACLEGEEDQHFLIGLAVRGPDNTDASSIISQPFMVMFSEDDDHMDIDELDRDINNIRTKRQILNNELPDYLHASVDGSLVKARMKHRPLDTSDVLRPEARKVSKGELEKHRKRRRRRRRKEKRLPHAWGKSWWKPVKNSPDYEGDDEWDGDTEVNDADLCQKRKMVVNFAEIGWGDWIISPKSFDASYCSGACPHPLHKGIQSTNHAIIQSLVQSLGTREDVPPLCCVASKLVPVSLLFYDENRNIVLKSYPNMSVQNCSCS